MFYAKDITTAPSSSSTTRVKVWAGIVHRVTINFPDGSEGLLKVKIFHGGHQVWPSDEDDSFTGDDILISFRDHYKLHAGFNVLRIEIKNDDDTFPHLVRVSFGVLPEIILSPYVIFKTIRGSLTTLLRRIGAV